MDIPQVTHALEQAIATGDVDEDFFKEYDTYLALYPEATGSAQALLPLFTQLAAKDLMDRIPETLVPRILEQASLDYILELIPVELFKAGLTQPSTAPVLLEILKKTTKNDQVGIELCEYAIKQLLDPYVTYAGKIEALVENLVGKHIQIYIPDQELFESTDPYIQPRLMALNITFLRHKIRPRFLFWDLTAPDLRDDLILMNIHIVYIGDLCSLGVDIMSQMPVLCQLYVDDEPFVGHDIERALLLLLEAQPIAFRELDAQYHLTEKQSVSFLAKLPPAYLENFPELIQGLVLSSKTLPVFANLCTDLKTFEMLNFSARAIEGLPFDLRAQLIAAVTINVDTARLFVGRFPVIMDGIVMPATNPETQVFQKMIQANLTKAGIRITAAPEIASAHDS